MNEVLKRNGSERQTDGQGMRTGEKRESERKTDRGRAIERGGSESKPVREEAPSEFQVVLMALFSHLDLYCSFLGISQGLPDTTQGCVIHFERGR